MTDEKRCGSDSLTISESAELLDAMEHGDVGRIAKLLHYMQYGHPGHADPHKAMMDRIMVLEGKVQALEQSSERSEATEQSAERTVGMPPALAASYKGA